MAFTSQTPGWQSPISLSPSTAPAVVSPTSAPAPAKKPGSAAPERKAKLRASCDACAGSKVKCSKEHPICARCSANGSQCIYGVSRKHGKPGRTRKRNPDGTPFIKASKQRPSPDGSEFNKFRVRQEPPVIQNLPDLDTMSNWSGTWSSTNSLPSTPEFEFDFEMTPEPIFMEPSDFNFMDDLVMPGMQMEPGVPQIPAQTQAIQPELTFRDPFAKKHSVQLELPDMDALKQFIGGDTVSPGDYSFGGNTMNEFMLNTPSIMDHSPMSSSSYANTNPLRVSISMPTSHCCYTLAYTTLESLRVINSDGSQPTQQATELKSLDSVLSITKNAVQNVLQLLACPCSSDPHLAMLYSSITSKILTWYQIAAGVDPGTTTPPSLASSPVSASTFSTSGFNSPLTTPDSDMANFNIQVQPVKIGLFEFDAAEQEELRRQVVLRELKKCGQLVDALANWRNDSKTEQAEFLYDVLGAWLKSEMFRTVKQVQGEEGA